METNLTVRALMLGSNLKHKTVAGSQVASDLQENLHEWIRDAAGMWLSTQKTDTAISHLATHVCGKKEFHQALASLEGEQSRLGYPCEEHVVELRASGLIRERDIGALLAKRLLGCPRSAASNERLKQLGLGTLSELHAVMLAIPEELHDYAPPKGMPKAERSAETSKLDDQRRWNQCQRGAEFMQPSPVPLTSLRARLLEPVRSVRARIARLTLDSAGSWSQSSQKRRAGTESASVLDCFIARTQQVWRFSPAWRRVLSELAGTVTIKGHDAIDVIVNIFDDWRLPRDEMEKYLHHAVQTLPDYAARAANAVARTRHGAIDRATAQAEFDELLQWVAIQMMIDHAALSSHHQSSKGANVNWAAVFESNSQLAPVTLAKMRAARQLWLYRLSKKLNWSVERLTQLTPSCWLHLHAELDAFPSFERRQIILEAIELEHSASIFRSLRNFENSPRNCQLSHGTPRFQLLACGEPSGENLRRHVAAIVPTAEVFPVAGFFNVPLALVASDSQTQQLHCPTHVRAGQVVHETHIESLNQQQPGEQLQLRTMSPAEGNARIEEMATRVSHLLKDAGLTGPFAPVVVVLGHGTKTQRTEKSTGECLFCNGLSSAPNARIFAQMANDERVRERLHQIGIRIGSGTRFVAAMHYECDGSVEFFEQHHLPVPLRPAFFDAQRTLTHACQLAYQERRESTDAFEQVVEYVCLIGRREITRGATMRPGTTLIAYDGTEDVDAQGLRRILSVVVPISVRRNLRQWVSVPSRSAHRKTAVYSLPMRTMFVVEADPEKVLRILSEHPWVGGYFDQNWLRLVSMQGGKFFEYRDGFFAERTHGTPLIAEFQ